MLVGACRDWRGVLLAAHNRSTYMQVFDVLFPRHIATLTRAAEVRHESHDVLGGETGMRGRRRIAL